MRLLVGFLFVYSGLGKYRKLRKFAEENGLPIVVAFLAVSAEFGVDCLSAWAWHHNLARSAS